jgi:SnoaL-like domain
MKRFPAIIAIAVLCLGRACRSGHDEEATVQTTAEQEQAIAGLRAAYAAFNRGDIAAAVELLDPQIEWTEPAEFPGGGTYHGQAGAKAYLTQSRESAAEVHSEPAKIHTRGRPNRRFCPRPGPRPR